MKQLFALSAIGRDRPGIVADLAELIYECDCNLEDSRMTILGSEFAVLLLLSGQGPDAERRLSAGCKRLEWEKRLTVFFRPLEGDAPRTQPPGRMLECTVTGADKAGIVARIARTLADHGANVADLRTELRPPEPESGTPIYTMRLVMRLAPAVDERALRAQLERDAAALCVDLTVGEPGSLPDDR